MSHVLIWAAQPDATSGQTAQAPRSAAPGMPPGGCASAGMTNIGLFAVMMVVFYFVLIRPQQKRQREHQTLLNSLKRGDKVRTTGGIRGEVVELDDTSVWLMIADKVKVNVLRSHIAGVERTPEKAQ